MDTAGIRMLSTRLENPNIIEPVSIRTLVELTRLPTRFLGKMGTSCDIHLFILLYGLPHRLRASLRRFSLCRRRARMIWTYGMWEMVVINSKRPVFCDWVLVHWDWGFPYYRSLWETELRVADRDRGNAVDRVEE